MARKISGLVSGGLPGPERAVNGARADREILRRAAQSSTESFRRI
jgi:hypothetical protein